jgi:Ca-activated chloride channel family protein
MWIKIAIFILLVMALARPYLYDSSPNSHKRGRDLVLAIDASGSMGERGFDKRDVYKKKFDATLEITREFINKRADDNIGVVLFGTFAYTLSPLTYDLQSLLSILSLTDVGIAGESTAIGEAIAQSIRSLDYGDAKSKVIVLLTDGHHNAGSISPKDALKKAKDSGIKVYTIGIGSAYDKGLLENIAMDSGGESYSAISADELMKVYENIERLEPSPIRSENFLYRYMLFVYPLGLAFGVLFFWVMMRGRE